MMPSSISDFIAAKLRLARQLGIDAVQLPEVDALHAEFLAAGNCLRAQPFGLPDHLPHAGARPLEPRFVGNDDAAIGMKRFADQLLRHVRPVGIGGVDEIDAKLGQPFQRAEGFRPVLGSPQMPLPVIRMAPKPRRLISISPPILNFPDFAASSFAILVTPSLRDEFSC